MYQDLDKALETAKKQLRNETNRLGVMGFDELNVINTRKVTKEMYGRLLDVNDTIYSRVAKKAYKSAKEEAEEAGYSGKGDPVGGEWLAFVLKAYNSVTGYLYDKEAERKRLRLTEQILTAKEFDNRQMFREALRKAANLWWTQTVQYGVTVVDSASIKAYKDMGVKHVVWLTAPDERVCSVCDGRDGTIYGIGRVPPKPHYGCRCRLMPVRKER